MIYGYCKQRENDDGPEEMKEVCIAASAKTLRAIASFLIRAAEELEAKDVSVHWHRHVDEDIRDSLGCELVVACDSPMDDSPLPFCDDDPVGGE